MTPGRLAPLAVLLGALAAAAPAAADGGARGAPAAASGASGVRAAAPRVRASHRVDVIAPGERVETVLDRARAASGTPVRGATGDVPLPVRPPGRRELAPRTEEPVRAAPDVPEGVAAPPRRPAEDAPSARVRSR